MKKISRLLVLVFICISVSSCGYNSLQSEDEAVKSAWSEVLNQFQRRADLVPNLVNTVKGYAAHERETLDAVVDARSKIGQMVITPEILNDPDAFAKFQAAQGQMSSALSRLLAVAENYPNLKADGSFRDLQAQLEGTENRITVARNRYIEAIKTFNITVRSFPSNLTAKMFGFTTKANFSVENEKALATPPQVQF